jgi:hypothetical protein
MHEIFLKAPIWAWPLLVVLIDSGKPGNRMKPPVHGMRYASAASRVGKLTSLHNKSHGFAHRLFV